MAGASITIDSAEMVAGLRQLQTALGDLRPVFRDIGEYLIISHHERFERQVSPDGQPWADLSAGYWAEKPYNQDKKLVLDGHLMDELHYNNPTETQLEFGANQVYAATHQFGREDVNIPARPFLGLSRDDEGDVLAIIYRHLQDALPS